MQLPNINKFGFRIRTRSGAIVDKLIIHGHTLAEAQEKLLRMYRGSEIVESWEENVSRPAVTGSLSPNSFEDIVDLINR